MLDFILGLYLALREWASATRESGRLHRQFSEFKRANRQYRRTSSGLETRPTRT